MSKKKKYPKVPSKMIIISSSTPGEERYANQWKARGKKIRAEPDKAKRAQMVTKAKRERDIMRAEDILEKHGG